MTDVFNVSSVVWFLVGSVIFYLIFKGEGFVQMDYGIFFPLMFLVLAVANETMKWRSRYKMPHVTANGFCGSIYGEPDLVYDPYFQWYWAVFNTGEAKDPFHTKGKLATLVIPLHQLNRVGSNFVAKTLVRRTDLVQIQSPPVNNHLRSNQDKFNLENIYYGFYSDDFKHENPKLEVFEQTIEGLNSLANSYRKTIEDKNDHYIEMVELAKKMSGSDKWWDKLKFKGDKDEE